ncbi:MAG TPA: hypothetical protein VK149_02550 [Sideroxyarcus sp.]|nr:hypothetical protein [Sideroxyarcus sp.]
MAEPSDPQDFVKRTLDHHFEQYLAFTRLILSLATGSFSLFTALSGTLLSSAQYVALAKAALPLLLVSMLSGVLVQYRIVHRPLRDLEKFEMLRQDALVKGEIDMPILFRKLPSAIEQLFFRVQVASFVIAFILLSCYAVLWVQAP